MSDDDDDATDPQKRLSESEIEAAELEDWRVLFLKLHARFRTGDFETGMKLVKKIGKAADKADHHPEIDLTYPLVDVRLSSHDAGGVTSRDIDLARQISGFAADLEAEAAPGELSVIELGLDTPDRDEVKPFWQALLGYAANKDYPEELNDSDGTRPTLWFQPAEKAKGEVQQRFHLDVRVPHDVAEDRVKAALEAGGTLVNDERAPTVWILADAHGNKACVTTWLGRDPDHDSSEGDAAGKISDNDKGDEGDEGDEGDRGDG